jgi:tripartite-type tricarboxylate transporter receptor subunit TctC
VASTPSSRFVVFRHNVSRQRIDPIGSTPEEFDVFLRKEIPRWKQIVQDGEVKVEGDR